MATPKTKTKKVILKDSPPLALSSLAVNQGHMGFRALFLQVRPWVENQKCIGKEINVMEAVDVIYDIMDREIRQAGHKENATDSTLGGLFSAEKLQEIESKIDSYFKSLPRQYSFFFCCPQLNDLRLGFQSINSAVGSIECFGRKKTEGSSLRDLLSGENYRPENDFTDGIQFGFHFRIKASGFAKSEFLSSASFGATRRFKHLIIGLLLEKTIDIGYPDWAGKLKDGRILLVDEENKILITELEIPENLKKLLGRIKISESVQTSAAKRKTTELATATLLGMPRDIHEMFLTVVPEGLKILLDSSTVTEDIECIRTASEWLFDAKLNDHDPSLKVMQIAAAAEAVLAEGKKIESNVTKTLADRCAYLLGSNAHGRGNIRKWFSDFYELRSQLVHGRSRFLSTKDQNMIDWAEGIVEAIIRKEMRFLPKSK